MYQRRSSIGDVWSGEPAWLSPFGLGTVIGSADEAGISELLYNCNLFAPATFPSKHFHDWGRLSGSLKLGRESLHHLRAGSSAIVFVFRIFYRKWVEVHCIFSYQKQVQSLQTGCSPDSPSL